MGDNKLIHKTIYLFMSKLTHYLTPLLIMGFLFLSSCSDPKPAEPVSFPTLKFTPSSNLSVQKSLKLARQIQLLTNNTEIIKISDTKSMLPTLDSNSLAIIEKILFVETLKVGDIVTYKVINPNSQLFGELIIHRIYSIDYKNQIIRAKGDNNEKCDPEIKFSQITGRVFCIIYTAQEIK